MATAMITENNADVQNENETTHNEDPVASDDPIPKIQKLKEDLRTVIDKMNEICKVNTAMLKKLAAVCDENDNLQEQVREQKIEIAELNQYGRRQNIEICNVPESIDQKDLENHVIEILKSLNIKIVASNIVGCHRIGKKSKRPRNVIVRFINRKTAFTVLKRKKELKNGNFKNYFVIENLCPLNKRIFNKLYRLKMEKEIHSVWSFNGQVFCKLVEDGDRIQVQHVDEIADLFNDYDSEYADDGNENKSQTADSSADNIETSKDGDGFRSDGFLQSSFSLKKKTPNRRLSIIEEETSLLRTPIIPLIIKI